jgi:hypothetical protein
VERYFLLAFICFAPTVRAADPCLSWFEKLKMNSPEDCLGKCASADVGMGTFDCPMACPRLCKLSLTERLTFNLSDLYPGLTPHERALVAEYPKDSLQVFLIKNEAEKMTAKVFERDSFNDESDALRHFLWAGLMLKKLGPDLAEKFLNAHESDSIDSTAEKSMDLANNRAGLIVAQRLIRDKKFSEENLLAEGLSSLKNGELVVLRRLGEPK